MSDSLTISPTVDADRHVYTVSELNQDVRLLLETGFPTLWLEGEISNFSCPSSGHWYFTLKDSKAQVRCAMFKNRNRVLDFKPENGDQILIKAKISLYEARGEYQLIVEAMEEAGYGALQRAFEALKKKLQAEGLFAASVKQDLPALPKNIGVISSPTGAAIRDILSVLKRRFPSTPVTLYPVQVQGDESAQQIVNAIHTATERNECDVLLISRGGGSLEDLWSFNEEIVACAIFHCPIPIVSGIGHEIDFTIADFVADKRAATPSAAAELISPDQTELQNALQSYQQHLSQIVIKQLQQYNEKLKRLGKQLKHPAQRLRELSQRIDELELRFTQALQHRLRYQQSSLIQQQTRLLNYTPSVKLNKYNQQLDYLRRALLLHMQHLQQDKKNSLAMASRTLNAVSPLATLDRGYAIVSERNTGDIVRSYNDVSPDEEIKVRLRNGQLICEVKETIAD